MWKIHYINPIQVKVQKEFSFSFCMEIQKEEKKKNLERAAAECICQMFSDGFYLKIPANDLHANGIRYLPVHEIDLKHCKTCSNEKERKREGYGAGGCGR